MKDYQAWFKLKTTLDKKQSKILFKEREIWWCSIGVNIGEEEDGKSIQFSRPVLVFRKLTSHSFIGLPLTTKVKKGSWYVPITLHQKTSCVMLNQVRTWDTKRFTSKIGQLDKTEFEKVKKAFLKFFS